MTDYYTENLAEFGYSEIEMLTEVLNAWVKNGLPDGFYNSGVKPAMNKLSGYVFLVNDDYQVAMMNGDSLEIYHTLPYSGIEGFLSDILDEYEPSTLHQDDVEYIMDIVSANGINLPEAWEA